MSTNSQLDNQKNAPGHQDPNQPQQDPGTVPGKEIPDQKPPVPGDPAQPDRQPAPGEPGRVPQPQA